jgi:hypothetical protein
MTSDNTSGGFLLGWHVMDEVSRETLDFEAEGFERSLDLTGDYFRYTNSFPIMLNGHYYLGLPGETRGFIGANVGVYYIERRVEAGICRWAGTLGASSAPATTGRLRQAVPAASPTGTSSSA